MASLTTGPLKHDNQKHISVMRSSDNNCLAGWSINTFLLHALGSACTCLPPLLPSLARSISATFYFPKRDTQPALDRCKSHGEISLHLTSGAVSSYSARRPLQIMSPQRRQNCNLKGLQCCQLGARRNPQ